MFMKEDYAELKKKEQLAKAELIRRINDIRNRLNTASVNALDIFIQGVKAGTNKE